MLDILDVKFIGKPFWGEGIENTKFVSDNSGREVRSYKGWLEQVLSMSVFIFVVIKVNTYGFSWLCGCWTRTKLNKTKLSLKPPRFFVFGLKSIVCSLDWFDTVCDNFVLFAEKSHFGRGFVFQSCRSWAKLMNAPRVRNSTGGSLAEFSPPTRDTRVRFPASAWVKIFFSTNTKTLQTKFCKSKQKSFELAKMHHSSNDSEVIDLPRRRVSSVRFFSMDFDIALCAEMLIIRWFSFSLFSS